MSIHLKPLDAFPNWALAIQFLRRSPVNFLLASEPPPREVPASVRARVVLHGVPSDGSFLSVPANLETRQIAALCEALLNQQSQGDQHYFGSIRGSNFVAFLNEFASILMGKFELDEVAHALTIKTRELFEAEGASILVPAKNGSNFLFAYVHAEQREVQQRLEHFKVPADKGVAGWVARNRKSILVSKTENCDLLNTEVDEHASFKTRNLIATHISIGDKLLGILEVVNKTTGRFVDSDLQILDLIASITSVFIEKARLYEERVKLMKMEREVSIAHALQIELMPELPARIGPFRLIGESRQFSRVGGDFWDIAELNSNETLLILGDVSGHGLSAAMVMSAVRIATRAILPRLGSPYGLIDPLNSFIHNEFGIKGHFVTLVLCYLQIEEKALHYFRAGHEYPVFKSSGDYCSLKRSGGLPLGLFPFRQRDEWGSLNFGPNDCLFLFTDGVSEGISEGELDMADLLRAHPDLEAALEQERFFDAISERFGWKDEDDATFLKLSLQ